MSLADQVGSVPMVARCSRSTEDDAEHHPRVEVGAPLEPDATAHVKTSAKVGPVDWSARRPAVEQPQPSAEAEARRALHICNVCGYCSGLCPVFDAAKRRPALAAGDLDQLANLCHHCRSCLYACQYAAPHPFALNVPRALARTRAGSYARYAWPERLARLFASPHRAALWASLMTTLPLLALVLISVPVERLWTVHQGPGAFYQVLPWGWMVLLAGLSLSWSLLALSVGLRRFWRASADAVPLRLALSALATALREALTLHHLHGGGPGCADLDARPSHWRRRWHHALVYGFLLSFAATVAATLYHHLLGRLAPYPFWSAPVLLGSVGGLLMLVGVIGLGWLGVRADPEPNASDSQSANQALLWLLGAVALSGLLLLLWRETAAMALLLILHLGLVLGLFLLLPYSKLVHGPYRLAALWRDALERQRHMQAQAKVQAQEQRQAEGQAQAHAPAQAQYQAQEKPKARLKSKHSRDADG